jgi:hypothetical protein
LIDTIYPFNIQYWIFDIQYSLFKKAKPESSFARSNTAASTCTQKDNTLIKEKAAPQINERRHNYFLNKFYLVSTSFLVMTSLPIFRL